MPALRIDYFGTPGIWFALSFGGMPRIYDLPLMPSLLLIAIAYPVVLFAWCRMLKGEGKLPFCLFYATAGFGYLVGLAVFLQANGEFQRRLVAVIFAGHVALGVWAIVRALRLCFQQNLKLTC